MNYLLSFVDCSVAYLRHEEPWGDRFLPIYSPPEADKFKSIP